MKVTFFWVRILVISTSKLCQLPEHSSPTCDDCKGPFQNLDVILLNAPGGLIQPHFWGSMGSIQITIFFGMECLMVSWTNAYVGNQRSTRCWSKSNLGRLFKFLEKTMKKKICGLWLLFHKLLFLCWLVLYFSLKHPENNRKKEKRI